MTEENGMTAAGGERSRLAMKLAIFAMIGAAALGLLALLPGMVWSWSGLGAFTLGTIPFALAAVFGFAAMLYGMLGANAAEEDYEKELLRKRKESQKSILDVAEDVRFTAGRTYTNYIKYAPSVFALLGAVITGLLLWAAWAKADSLGAAGLILPKDSLALAFVAVLGGVFALFAGVFLAGQSRIHEFRWLRPVGAWYAAGALVWFLSAIPSIALHYGNAGLEMPFAKGVFVLLVILGLEFLFSFISEFYRPRTQLEDRPVFESKILALFIDPGSVAKNIANTLDYQFGFKVSGTWMYSKFCEVAIPAIGLWLIALWIFTCIAEVGPGELGLRTRFGAFTGGAPLQPGVYLKLPWPCENILRVPVDVPHQVTIGLGDAKAESSETAPDAQKKNQTILWTTQHTPSEAAFLVANDSTSREIGNAVSMLNANLPVIYTVNKDRLTDYAFRYRNVDTFLTDMGTHEATIYFASTDFIKDLSVNRTQITSALKKRIQAAADKARLGINIISVNLIDTHPPVENVASAFQDVFIAQEEMGAAIQKAKAFETNTLAASQIDTFRLVQEAETYRYNVTMVSQSEAAQYRSRLAAYRAMPAMFKLRTYLDFLENDCAPLRKYVVSSSIPYQILELNAEEKPRLDLLDADLSGEVK